jgi:hypothetical protein
MESSLKLVKKLSNKVVDLKRNYEKGISKYKPLCPFHKKIFNQAKPIEPSNMNLNLKEVGMDHFFTYHQTNSLFEKTFPQWINSITLVINKMLVHQSLAENPLSEDEVEVISEEEDTIKGSAMFHWDWVANSNNNPIE